MTYLRIHGTTRRGTSFNYLEKRVVFARGEHIPGRDPDLWRKDVCGAYMFWHDHGNTLSDYGWEIDHIYPVSAGGTDDIDNLQPLQWQNNRSKGDKLFGNYCAVK